MANLSSLGQGVDASHSTFNDIGRDQNNYHYHADGDLFFHTTQTTNNFTTPHYNELIDRLDAVNYLEDLETSLELKLDGTCEWALSHGEVQNWIARAEGAGRGIWICGKPGSGKTIISAALIDHVRKLSPTTPPSTTLFFFCNNKANYADYASDTAVLRAFLVQMLADCGSDTDRGNNLARTISGALGTNRKLAFRQIAKAFKAAVESFSSIRIMIDAIDEYQNRVQLIEFLNDLLVSSESSTNVRVLLTSRDESDIRQRVDSPLWKRVDVTGEQDQNTVDIERYVAHKIDKLGATMPQLRENPELTDKIRDRLLQSADGMFLYVRVMFDLIAGLEDSSVHDIEIALASLPSGRKDLKTMYVAYFRELAQRAVDYHSHQDNHNFSDSLTLRALWWLVGAKRPLRLEEISMAIILSTSDDKVEQKKMLANSREVVSRLLGALVDIRRPRPDWIIGPPDGTNKTSGLVVTLIHASVKEFLTAAPESCFTNGELATRFLVSNQRANAWIATRCLSYLTLDGVFAEHMLHFREGEYYTALPLLQYSAEHWADHIIDSQSAGAKDVELRLALARFISSALKRVLASVLCMSVGLPKICEVWGKWSRKALAIADVGLCLDNTTKTVQTVLSHVPDVMAALSSTAASLPERFSPPPYAPYDLRGQSPGVDTVVNKIFGDGQYDLLLLMVPFYDTRGDDAYKVGAPRSVQLALDEVVRQFPTVRNNIHNTQILLDASTKLRNAALALASVEAQQLATSSGADATNVVAAFFVTVQAIDMLVALPCLPYVPVDTFDADGVFRTNLRNPSIARHVLADILRTPRTGSIRSAKQLEWRISLYELMTKRSTFWDYFGLCAAPIIFPAIIRLGGWDIAFAYTSIALYTGTKRQPLYSFQAPYNFNHYRLREKGQVRLAITSFIAGRIFERLRSVGLRGVLTWLGGTAAFTIGLSILHEFYSVAFVGQILLFQGLLPLFRIISTPAAMAARVVVISIVWKHNLRIGPPVLFALSSLRLADYLPGILNDASVGGTIETLWLADVLYTFYILVADPAGIRETLENKGLVLHAKLILKLLDIMPGQLFVVRCREMARSSTLMGEKLRSPPHSYR